MKAIHRVSLAFFWVFAFFAQVIVVSATLAALDAVGIALAEWMGYVMAVPIAVSATGLTIWWSRWTRGVNGTKGAD